MPFPGFVGTLGANVSLPAQNMGHLGWLLSFTTSFVLYWLICLVWPTQNQKMVKELGLGWEEMSYKEIVGEDGTIITEGMIGHPDLEPVKTENHETKALKQ